MPFLIMLVGLPGSGKSSYRHNLIKNLDDPSLVVLSTDDFIDEKAAEEQIPYAQAFKKYAKQANKAMNAVKSKAISEKFNVVWDQTNLTRETRARKLAEFISAGYEIDIVAIVTTVAEIKRINNDRSMIGRDLPVDVLEGMIDSFEMPTEAEYVKLTGSYNKTVNLSVLFREPK